MEEIIFDEGYDVSKSPDYERFKKGCRKLIELMNLLAKTRRLEKELKDDFYCEIASQIILIIDLYFPSEALEKAISNYLDFEKDILSEIEDEDDKTVLLDILKGEFSGQNLYIQANDEELKLIEAFKDDFDKEDGFFI